MIFLKLALSIFCISSVQAVAQPQFSFFTSSATHQASTTVHKPSATSSSTIAFASSTASSSSSSSSGTACNNSPLLCNRNYNNITHLGAHDAAFLRDSSTSFSISGNQFYNATIALSAGVRLIQAQVHNLNGVLELCHTSCSLLDAGPLETFLGEIKTWMDSNPNEVVTLLLVNSDDNSTAAYGSVFEGSGISEYGYTPSTTSGPLKTWPTLQTLITANTRLITFIASITYSSTYPYLLPEFSFVFETPFTVTSLSGFNCTVDRPSSLASSSSTAGASAVSSGYIGLANHFADTVQIAGITIPDVTDISTTNSAAVNTTGALGLHASTCRTQWGSKPGFLLVDFWNVGPALSSADLMNGLSDGDITGRTSVSTSVLTSTTSGATRDIGGFVAGEKSWRWHIVIIGVTGLAAGLNAGIL